MTKNAAPEQRLAGDPRVAPWLVLLAALACTPTPPPAQRAPPAAAAPAARAPGPRASAATAVPKREEPASDCGTFRCWSFDDPKQALARVLEEPVDFLAVGETHAQKGHADVRSTTRRFQEELLPVLPHFQAMLLELLIPPSGCPGQEKKEQAVRKDTHEVVKAQSPSNQSEFLELATAAKRRSIVPYPLRLTCADLDELSQTDDKVVRLLSWIAERTRDRALELQEQGKAPILLYGGALHNDLEPRAGRESWSFGPALATQGRYVELDLISREFIEDRSPWTDQPWFPAYRAACQRPGALLIEQERHSFALILPWQKQPGACPSAEPPAPEEGPPETPDDPEPAPRGQQ